MPVFKRSAVKTQVSQRMIFTENISHNVDNEVGRGSFIIEVTISSHSILQDE